MAKTKRKPAGFQGFSREAPGFFHQLAAEMSREWFTAHKDEYEALWVAPLTQLMEEVATRIKPAFRGLTLHPPKLFRIHRDVRFAKDKSPYKTHAAAVIRVSTAKKIPADGCSAAMYLHLGADGEYVGAGRYMFEPAAMTRWRKLVADGKTGGALTKLIAGARAHDLTVEPHEQLARVPKPYAAEHPRADLLRYKGLLVGFPEIPRGMIHRADFTGWLVDRVTEAAPVVSWVAKKLD
jgi:uncharacterized protein (TIGR02453 family)